MPFTPFHMGLGLAAKAVAPRLVSLQVFGLAQVAMDVQPAVATAMGSSVLHGWTHTLWGAVPVALASVVIWRVIEGRRIWRWTFERLSIDSLWVTSFVAVWSHVLLDALIHRDMGSTRALLPGLGDVFYSHDVVEIACMVAASLGLLTLRVRLGVRAPLAAIWSNLRDPVAWFRKPL